MLALPTLPSARLTEFVVSPLGDNGNYVLKDLRTGAYFQLGRQEAFLLEQLDGRQTPDTVRTAYRARFGQALSEEDLHEFLALAQKQGLLLLTPPAAQPPAMQSSSQTRGAEGMTPPPAAAPSGGAASPPFPSRQSLLYWRFRLFNPDAFFNWLGPKIGFFWSRTFVVLSLAGIVTAACLVWTNWQDLVSSFTHALRWQTLALVWGTLLVATLCHEFAHGLTCKRYGGQVHEVGFLLLFLWPCFYCNVSDAWLFREKSKRLWVTLAGGYWDLCLWAGAVFLWRFTRADSLPNYLAWVVLSVLGTRIILNANPLIKLDGYYLLSDLLEIPNLQQRGVRRLMDHLRWLLWGATRPEPTPQGKWLLIYGLASWLFSLSLVALLVVACVQFLGERWGLIGVLLTLGLGALVLPGLFQGLLEGEVSQMIHRRPQRTTIWLVLGITSAAVLICGHGEEYAGGPFLVRPVIRAELRAPVAGFLTRVYFEEGNPVGRQAVVAYLEVPNLASRIAQKRAEFREEQARLRLLQAGPRLEEVAAQGRRVERAMAWRNRARQELARFRRAADEEVRRMNQQIAQHHAEVACAGDALDRARCLWERKALAAEPYHEALRRYQVCQAQLEQAEAQKRGHQAVRTLAAEAEVVRRESDLAEARSTLTLLRARPRPEEIEARHARLARLEEEIQCLAGLEQKARIRSPVSGLLTTPRLTEKVGRYFQEGELVCVIEEPTVLEVEIRLAEQDLAGVQPGQTVELKARTSPFQTFEAGVDRIAPRATSGEVQSSVSVYCQLRGPAPDWKPGMIGYARIQCGRRTLGQLLISRILRLLRTEFW